MGSPQAHVLLGFALISGSMFTRQQTLLVVASRFDLHCVKPPEAQLNAMDVRRIRRSKASALHQFGGELPGDGEGVCDPLLLPNAKLVAWANQYH
jgi:hypothetical protein